MMNVVMKMADYVPKMVDFVVDAFQANTIERKKEVRTCTHTHTQPNGLNDRFVPAPALAHSVTCMDHHIMDLLWTYMYCGSRSSMACHGTDPRPPQRYAH